MANKNFNEKFANWMHGRNGEDDIARFTSWLGIIVALINLFFTKSNLLSALAILLIAYSMFRIFSKNIAARARENERFMASLGPLRPWVAMPISTFKDRRKYAYLKCPNCGQKARVPKGKGRVRVSCRRCGTKYEGKA